MLLSRNDDAAKPLFRCRALPAAAAAAAVVDDDDGDARLATPVTGVDAWGGDMDSDAGDRTARPINP